MSLFGGPRVIRGVMSLAVLAGTAVTSVGPSAQAATGPHRDASGLWVVPETHPDPIPPDLMATYDALTTLSEAQPTAYGYVHLNAAKTGLVLPVTSAGAAGAVAGLVRGSLAAGESNPSTSDPYGKLQAKLARVIPTVVTVVGVNSGQPRRLALSTRTGSVAMPQTTTSRAVLDSIADAAIELSKDPQFEEADIWRTWVDRDNGRVVVTAAHLTDGLAARLVADFGTDLVAVTEQPNPQARTTNGRLLDRSPHRGGNRIITPVAGGDYVSCTGGFSWWLSAAKSGPGMLTAGHCAPYGGAVKADTAFGNITSMTRENWTPGVGSALLPGEKAYRGDMALIQLYSGRSIVPSIYRGAANSSSTSTVSEMWSRRAAPGDQFCTGGSMAGEICGWVVDKVGVQQKVEGGAISRNVVVSKSKQGWCVQVGDSGGPVFTVTPKGTIAAKGLISTTAGGGSDSYGGVLDPCTTGFTDIWDPYVGFPGKLAT